MPVSYYKKERKKGRSREDYKQRKDSLDEEIDSLEKMLAKKKQERERVEQEEGEEIERIQADSEKASDELEKVTARINEISNMPLEEGKDDYIEKINQKIQEYNDYIKNKETVDYVNRKRKELNDVKSQGEQLKEQKKKIIEESDLPVEGLSFSDDELLYKGVRVGIDQTSTSQNMELATKLAIKSNDKTKIFLISQGESIGKEKMKNIAEIAQREGFQGFIEYRDDSDELTIEEYQEK